MKAKGPILFVLAVLAGGVNVPGSGSCRWPGEYLATVAKTPLRPGLANEPAVRAKLEHYARKLPRIEAHVALVSAVASRGDAKGLIVLEACFPELLSGGTGYFGVAAIHSESSGDELIISEQGAIQVKPLAHEQWVELEALIRGAVLKGGLGPDMQDGTAYFAGWALNGQLGQFAVYSPLEPSICELFSKETQEYSASISHESEFVWKLLGLSRKTR